MIFLVPLLLYVALTIGLVYFFSWQLKDSALQLRRKVAKRTIFSALLLFPFLGFFYVSYLFGLALEDHRNVQPGTFLWYATMDNSAITDFPQIEPIGQVRFGSIGGDSPNIGTGWEIEYTSEAKPELVIQQITDYLQQAGYDLEAVDQTRYYWIGKNKKSNTNVLYSGSNEKGEALDLYIQKMSSNRVEIECSIVY